MFGGKKTKAANVMWSSVILYLTSPAIDFAHRDSGAHEMLAATTVFTLLPHIAHRLTFSHFP